MKFLRLAALGIAFFVSSSSVAFAARGDAHWPHFGKAKQGKSFGPEHHKTRNPHNRAGQARKLHKHKQPSS
jgi:hypothetical protein